MSSQIDAVKLCIKDVFSRWYRIPNYQRPYVWEKDQIFELLDDICNAYHKDKNSEYFLGSLVLQKHKVDGYDEFNVLDGQQRLTTLFLITAVIRDLTNNVDRKTTCQGSIFQKANLDDDIPERLRIIFDIRGDVQDFINNYVKNENSTSSEKIKEFTDGKEQNTSINNIAKAILHIREYFSLNGNVDEVFDKLVPFLRNKVILISVSTENLSDAFKLFTVLNNRGVKLRNADILKAENLGLISNLSEADRCAKDWEDMENYFGEGFDEFLSHLQSILTKDKLRMDLRREFEENIFGKNKLTKGKPFFDFVKKYKKHYDELFESNSNLELKNILKVMSRGFESNIWIAPLLKYYDKFSKENILEFTKKLNNKFACDWIYGCTPNDRIVNMNTIIKQIEKSESSLDLLKNDCLSIEKDKNSIIEFLNGDIYGKRQARYILLLLNYLFSNVKDIEFSIPNTISIEHILPQNPKDDSQWKKDFSDEECEKWTNKLGNLIILSRRKNSSQSNLDFELKKNKYFKGNVELGRSAYIMTKETWKLENLISNHEEVVRMLKENFEISS